MHDKPNVIIVTCHDLGRHLGCYGVNTVHTPEIDKVAGDGVLFSNYFAASPVCSPSRATMLTGRYPQTHGLMGLTHEPWGWSMHEGERHLSHLMSEAGYRTALFGIQHETSDIHTLGFQEFYSQKSSDRRPVTCHTVARELADFMRRVADSKQPFYAQVGFFETHRPFNLVAGAQPDDSKGVYIPPYILDNEQARAEFAQLQGDVRSVDEAIKSIQAALQETRLDRNTLFVFTVDHGIEFARAKWYCYDPGIEIAMIMRWPGGGLQGGKRCEALLSNVDFLPTLLDLIGVPTPENLDGISCKPLISGEMPNEHRVSRNAIFSIFEGGLTMVHPTVSRAVRTERFKLIRNFWPARKHKVPVNISKPELNEKMPVVQLFDLQKDPGEFHNVADDPAYADAKAELDGVLWNWLESVNDPILKGPTPTPYYQEAISDYPSRNRNGASQ